MVPQNPSGFRFVEFWTVLAGQWLRNPSCQLKDRPQDFNGTHHPQSVPQLRWQRLLHQSKTAANGKAKEAHKRQISQAIPRNERDNGELSRPKAAPASSRSTQRGTQEDTRKEGTQEGTRKSVRARKPKTHS